MSAGRRRVVAVLLALAAAGAGGCGGGGGGGGGDSTVNSADTSPSNAPSARSTPSDLALPEHVPQHATGPADRVATRVIRRWLAALRRGDIERAAHFFSLPSIFQNTGTPVLHIDTDQERIAINLSLPCGARAEKAGGAGRYTIVLFRLTDRPGPGGGCGSGAGATARGAILVSGGLIREWYRLPDEPSADDREVPAPSA
jgi:hypothetical protein